MDYLTAKEAAAELGISLPTLYAYVSRGLVRSEVADAGKRTRRYRREDIDKLKQRQEQRRHPEKVVADALHWGTPLLDSAITLIAGGRLFYRGRDALALALAQPVEAVAALIWQNDLQADIPELRQFAPDERLVAAWPPLRHLSPVEQFQGLLPLAAAEDWSGYNLQPEAVVKTGGRILRLLAGIAAGNFDGAAGIAANLQQSWRPDVPAAEPLLNAALVLCADHELNVSSFTARCVASAGASPYQVVLAGLAALQGVKHGRVADRVASFLAEINSPAAAGPVIAARLRRGESIPGFGHPLYPQGDPRGRLLLEQITALAPNSAQVKLAAAVSAEVEGLLGLRPTIDFGLVTAARALNLPPDAPITLFALGRTIGWIGQALEAYAEDRIIRPRARYVGHLPES